MNSISNPSISILLPVFNGERYLKQCISSILAQSFTNFELLISNDCSTDNTEKIIKEFSDQRIQYMSNDNNQGLFKNLNKLLALAKAPIIRFICQDDILFSDCLKTELNFFENHPEVGIIWSKSCQITEKSEQIDQCVLGDLPDVIEPLLSLQLFFYFGCIPSNLSTVSIRKQCIEKYGFFDESFQVSGDYEMWFRICQHENMGVIHKHLLQVRSHINQLSRASKSGIIFIKENRKILDSILPLLPPEIHNSGQKYRQLRQNVASVHHAMRCLQWGRFQDLIQVIKIMGLGDFTRGWIFWLLTLNNRLYKPKPKFVSQ
jgi:glycosyltransferase involved in cell wall biosynthesis